VTVPVELVTEVDEDQTGIFRFECDDVVGARGRCGQAGEGQGDDAGGGDGLRRRRISERCVGGESTRG